MRYEMKWLQETGWAVLVAVAVYALTAIVEASVLDPKALALAVGAGAVRIAAATVLSRIKPKA